MTPTNISEEGVGGFCRVLGAERAFDLKPMIVVQVLLLGIREAHEQQILDLLALGERPAGGVQALEDLLGIFFLLESDADDPEPLEALEQVGRLVARNEAAGDSPGLAHRAGARGRAFEAQTVFVVVAVLKP